MSENGKCRLGFLTAVEAEGHGYVGGLLVTNRYGRPLEFQCTTPVKPNRTQEILYGPTLLPFVLAELIGRTLVERIGVKPDLILTEQPEMLELRNHVSIPVACLTEISPAVPNSAEPTVAADQRTTKPVPAPSRADELISVGRQVLRLHRSHASDRSIAENKAVLIPRDADLCEPFGRVRQALGEAMQPGAPR